MKRKLPAYGAALRAARREGRHPPCVHLVFGRDWRAELNCDSLAATIFKGEHPRTCVLPHEFQPGLYDWSIVTGLQVSVFDQECLQMETSSVLYPLLGELGAYAADIYVHSPGMAKVSADMLAMANKWGVDWPAWWPAEIEEKNAKRRSTWWSAATSAVCID